MMIRKQIDIESRQDEGIKQRARKLGITEAEVIRKAIDGQMASLSTHNHDLSAWEREKAFIVRRASIRTHRKDWIPAFVGMTEGGVFRLCTSS